MHVPVTKQIKRTAWAILILLVCFASHAVNREPGPMQKLDKSPILTTASETPSCLKNTLTESPGKLNAHVIDLNFTGRTTVGDLDADDSMDFVVANRHRLAAYNICGNQLWELSTNTNWDSPSHAYWNWTSYGYIGDADGDGRGEFLHIGDDWRTLFVRDGLTGTIEHEIDLGSETKWMYVLLGRRAEDEGNAATRIFVTGRPGDNNIKAIDIRSGVPVNDWYYSSSRVQNAYMPPIAVDIDQLGGDELVHSTIAVDGTGKQIWRHTFSDFSVLGAAHTLTVKDIEPDKPGLEAIYSVYEPKKGAPSLVSIAPSKPAFINWKAYSPHLERHPHQHTVGDFDLKRKGLEILARNSDAQQHWLIDATGDLIDPYLRLDAAMFPAGWDSGELVQGIEWDHKPGTEVLYTERHVSFREIPRLVITSSTQPVKPLTRFFHGGIDTNRIDNDPELADKPDPTFSSWFGYVNRPSKYDNDGPYEGAAHAIDLFGDGREEILTWGAKKIIIYYNSGDARIQSRRTSYEYLSRKKLWTNVYNPR